MSIDSDINPEDMASETPMSSSAEAQPAVDQAQPEALVQVETVHSESDALAEEVSSSDVSAPSAEHTNMPADGVEEVIEVDCSTLDDRPVREESQEDNEPLEGVAFDEVMSGSFDETIEQETEQPFPKRVLPPKPHMPKLHKVLAQAGLGSRLEMEKMIADGKISVNEEPAHVGQRIQFGDKVRIGGKLLRLNIAPPKPRVLAYHKPVGELVTHDDPKNRPTVFRRLPRLQLGKWQSVGRLDLNTEGLLLFTNSGDLANRLMHPSFGLEREYAVRVLGRLTDEAKQQLLDGIELEDGMAQLLRIEDGQATEGANCWYKVVIGEGRNREVRRLFEAVGHVVSRLIRIRYGAMLLPRGLKRGYYVELDERDISALTELAGINLDELEPPKLRQRKRRNNRPNTKGNNHKGNKNNKQARADSAEDDAGQDGQNRRGGRGKQGDRRGGDRRGDRRGNQRGNARGGQQKNQQKTQQRQKQGRERGHDDDLPDFNLAGVSHESGVVKSIKRAKTGRGRKGSGGGEPDPMRTSYGYIGGDSYERQQGNKSGGSRSGGGRGRRSR